MRNKENERRVGALASAAVVALASAVGLSAPTEAEDQERAEQIVQGMTKRLADSRTLKFKAVREMDAQLAQETGMPPRADIEVSVMRPNRVKGRAVAGDQVRVFVADGQWVTVSDETMKVYAKAPISGSIDEMSRKLEERFGFAPPIGELLSNNAYGRIRSIAPKLGYGGVQTLEGKSCHKILLSGDRGDGELFVSVEDKLPCGLMVAFKDTEGRPKLRMSFSGWELGARLKPSDFAYTPPEGAQEVEMVPVEALEPPAGEGQNKRRTQ